MAGTIVKQDAGLSVPEIVIQNKSGVTRSKRAGTVVRELAVALFDTAGTDSSGAANTTIAAHGLGVYLPTKAIITNVIVDVVTTFTSATDAATVALKAQAADDIVAAIAISDATNVWDAGLHGSKIGYPNFGADAAHDSAVEVAALFSASMLKLTAARELTATVAVEALTAGKANIFVEYIISD
jgi:hypothetical protein